MINEHGWKEKEKQELAMDKQGKAWIEFFTHTNNRVQKITRNSFEKELIIVTRKDSMPWLWITAPALRIS